MVDSCKHRSNRRESPRPAAGRSINLGGRDEQCAQTRLTDNSPVSFELPAAGRPRRLARVRAAVIDAWARFDIARRKATQPSPRLPEPSKGSEDSALNIDGADKESNIFPFRLLVYHMPRYSKEVRLRNHPSPIAQRRQAYTSPHCRPAPKLISSARTCPTNPPGHGRHRWRLRRAQFPSGNLKPAKKPRTSELRPQERLRGSAGPSITLPGLEEADGHLRSHHHQRESRKEPIRRATIGHYFRLVQTQPRNGKA